MNCSMEHPGGNGCAYGARAACVAGHLKQHMGLVAAGAHIAMHAEADRTGDRWTLVLPSHNIYREEYTSAYTCFQPLGGCFRVAAA